MTFVPTVRKPTGVPAAPLIMVSGPPKSGKSLQSYKLGLADTIDQCWVIDLGEGSADEYGAIGSYQVLDWGRSWADLQDTVRWCIAQPCPEGQMNALIIDSGTEVWDGLKARADKRARNSKRNKEALAKDPDFEVDVSMPFWNDAKETWARVVSPMKLAGHLVGVILVRSEIVAEVVNGAPTNRKVTSYQCERTLQGVATAHVEIRPDHSAHLIEVRSMHVSVGPKGIPLADENPLGDLLTLLSPTSTFGAPIVATPVDDERDTPPAPVDGGLAPAAVKDLWSRVVAACADPDVAARLRAVASDQRCKLTEKNLAKLPSFAQVITEHLDQLEQVAA